jgi:hypothetical protein
MPRYRTRRGVVIDTSEQAAEFLGAEPFDGDTPETPQEQVEPAGTISPPQPEGGPAEPVQEPAPVAPPQPPDNTAPETVEMTAQVPPPDASPEGDAGETSSLSDDDYSQWTVAELRAEMRKRNEGRDEATRLHLSQDKRDLIDDLRADDQQ